MSIKYFFYLCIIVTWLSIACDNRRQQINKESGGKEPAKQVKLSDKELDDITEKLIKHPHQSVKEYEKEIAELKTRIVDPVDKAIFMLYQIMIAYFTPDGDSDHEDRTLNALEEPIMMLRKYAEEHQENDNQWICPLIGLSNIPNYKLSHVKEKMEKKDLESLKKSKEFFVRGLKYEYSRLDCLVSLYQICLEDSTLVGQEFYDEMLSYTRQLADLMPFNLSILTIRKFIEKSSSLDDKSIRDILRSEFELPASEDIFLSDYVTEEESKEILQLSWDLKDLRKIAEESKKQSDELFRQNKKDEAIELIKRSILFYRYCAYDYFMRGLRPSTRSLSMETRLLPLEYFEEIGICYIKYAQMVSDHAEKIRLYKTAIYYYRISCLYGGGIFVSIPCEVTPYFSIILGLQNRIKELESQLKQDRMPESNPK